MAFWRWSVLAEVYSLQDAFIALLIYLSLRWRFNLEEEKSLQQQKAGQTYILLIPFIFALSIGVHITNILFLLPLIVFGYLAGRKILLWKTIFLAVFFGLLGFSVFVYLPLRAVSNPPLALGQPLNITRFIAHLTGRGMPQETLLESFSAPFSLLSWQVYNYLGNLIEQLSLLGFFFGVVGLIYHIKKDLPVFLLTLMTFLANVLFFIRIWVAAFGYMPSFLVFSIWIGIGFLASLNFISQWGERTKRPLAKAFLSLFLVSAFSFQFALSFLTNSRRNNLSQFYTTHTMINNLLNSLEYKSFIITRYSIPFFLIWYAKFVENRRPDLIVTNLQHFPSDEDIKKLVHHEGYNYNYNIYWTGNDKTALFPKLLVPNGLVFRFELNHPSSDIPGHDFHKHLYYRTVFEKDLRNDPYIKYDEGYNELYKINSELFYYYRLRGDLNKAKEEFQILVKLNPDSSLLNLFYGLSLVETRNYPESIKVFPKVLRSNPRFEKERLFKSERNYLLFVLGITLLNQKDYLLAIEALTKVRDGDPLLFGSQYYLGLALEGAGRYREALKEFKLALDLKPDDEEIIERINILNKRVYPETLKGK